jgi:hypothetical protein
MTVAVRAAVRSRGRVDGGRDGDVALRLLVGLLAENFIDEILGDYSSDSAVSKAKGCSNGFLNLYTYLRSAPARWRTDPVRLRRRPRGGWQS